MCTTIARLAAASTRTRTGGRGFLNAYRLSGREEFAEAALRTWSFIDSCVIDHAAGEWYTRVSREGVPESGLPKADFWKCPYHDTRAMLETMDRVCGVDDSGGP